GAHPLVISLAREDRTADARSAHEGLTLLWGRGYRTSLDRSTAGGIRPRAQPMKPVKIACAAVARAPATPVSASAVTVARRRQRARRASARGASATKTRRDSEPAAATLERGCPVWPTSHRPIRS